MKKIYLAGNTISCKFNSYSKKETLPLIIAVLFFILLYISLAFQLTLYDDGAAFGTIIKEICVKGEIIDYNPNGWVLSPVLGSPSVKPILTYGPSFFFISNSLLTLFTNNERLSLNISATIFILLLIIITYKLFKLGFPKKIAIYSAFLIPFIPLIYFFVGGYMETTLGFLCILSIYWYIKFKSKPTLSNSVVLSLLLLATYWVKFSSIILIIAISILLLLDIKSEGKSRKIILIFCIFLILSTPLFLFTVQSNGTLSLTQTAKIPILDNYVFHPWWNWEKEEWDKQLDKDSNWRYYEEKRMQYSLKSRSTMLENLMNGNIKSTIQFFSAFPLSSKVGEYHIFQGYIWSPLFLFLVVIGILGYLVSIKKNLEASKNLAFKNFNLVLIILTVLFIYVFLNGGIILRHMFYFLILCMIFYGYGIYFIAKKLSKLGKILLVMVVIIALIQTSMFSYQKKLDFKNSFGHVFLQKGGRKDLKILKKEIKLPEHKNIFAPAEEVPYYLNRRVIWDERIFFVSEEKLPLYFMHFNVSYLIIPKWMLREIIGGKYNKIDNYPTGNVWNPVPTDSAFYKLLIEEKHFKKVKEYGGFYVYRFDFENPKK